MSKSEKRQFKHEWVDAFLKSMEMDTEKSNYKNLEELNTYLYGSAEVIGLMMYLGDPPKLTEHLLTSSRSKCLDMKQIAEETSFAYYECAVVDANIRGGKIISINEELKVLE